MQPTDIVAAVFQALTHDADQALTDLVEAGGLGQEDGRAAAVFLQVMSCRFDEALDAALIVTDPGSSVSPLARAATDFAVAVCAGEVTAGPVGDVVDGPMGHVVTMLQVEAAMSSGLISTAADVASHAVGDGPVRTPTEAWSAIALTRAWGFEGRFPDADALLDTVLGSPSLAGWPQMALLARGARIFVDGHLGRSGAVDEGLAALRHHRDAPRPHDYIGAGALVLAAFGVHAIGRLADASELILRGGGGDHLPHLQVVDRMYGYEILVEDALARSDLEAAHGWSELATVLPIRRHAMATAALGRLKARVAVAHQDSATGIRESADSGILAALVGSDLEVIRARVIEASARAAGGDRIRGIEELEDVARRAGATGAAAVKEWAERELHLHGRRLRNVPGLGWEGLTTTQQAIAQLAAAGLRNREISAALWISEKTVESHVAAVLSALGTVNRVGIGRELGLDATAGDEHAQALDVELTARQREVAALVACGRSNGEISAVLGITEKTVEKHVAGLFARLGVRTRAAVAARVRGASSTPGHPH